MIASASNRGGHGPLLMLLGLALAACGSDHVLDPDPGPAFLGLMVLENPHNTISARAVIEARGVDSAFVRFWRSGGLITPPRSISPCSTTRWGETRKLRCF